MQLVVSVKDYAAGDKAYNKIIAVIKIGDIIGARGYPGKSKGGKLSLVAVELVFPRPLQANAGGQGNITDKIEEEQNTSVGCENGERNEQRKKRDVCIEDESKQEDESTNGPSAEVTLTSHSTAQSLPANETVDDATSAVPEADIELDGTDPPPLSTIFLNTKLKADEKKAENEATKAAALDCRGNEPELKGASSIVPSPEDTVPSISDDESLPANEALQNNLTSAMPKEM